MPAPYRQADGKNGADRRSQSPPRGLRNGDSYRHARSPPRQECRNHSENGRTTAQKLMSGEPWRNNAGIIASPQDSGYNGSVNFNHSFEVIPGIIMHLPGDMKTGKGSPSQLFRNQEWVNKAATQHPVLVWDTYINEKGEQIARCLQMTSFGNKSIEEKYNMGWNAWRFHCQYVPIQQGQMASQSVTNMPSLELEGGNSMSKGTYVHLDHYFDIEARFLEAFPKGSTPPQLTRAALCVVIFKLEQFFQEKIYRARYDPKKRGSVKSPMDLHVGKIELGREALEKAREGMALESARGAYVYTGLENRGPREFVQVCAENARRTKEQKSRGRYY
jgi:hypothetical protein